MDIARGADRKQPNLDVELNLRARWPEHAQFFERWAAQSAKLRAEQSCQLDLAYGPSAGQRLDFFPAGSGAPLLVFIHGGYWQSLDKGDFSYLAAPFVERGIAFASLNYDLAPAVGIPDIVGQIRRAVAWLTGQAPALGFDPDRLFLSGHSAGGHLACMMLCTNWVGVGLPHDLVKGAVSIAGIYDLEPLASSYQQPVLKLDAAAIDTASPLRLTPQCLAPLILALGEQETPIFHHQQAALAERWGKAMPISTSLLRERHHFSVVDALAEVENQLFQSTLRLIETGRLS